MGVAIAEQLAAYGALVTLVLGPSNLIIKNKLIHVISVESSDEMYKAMISNFKNKYLVICSAVVADYKPVLVYKQKIKKKENHFKLELTKTKDILIELGNLKTKQCLVGFALESENLVNLATQKLIE